jgi:bifunctional DNA-binding transcriptional regulator/antitoxin component of YhaV-PrlF toxin-antitoxin module
MTVVSVDNQGKIYLPKYIREDLGERVRVVKLESGIKVIPIDEDPVEGLREATDGAEGIDLDNVGEKVEEKVKEEL